MRKISVFIVVLILLASLAGSLLAQDISDQPNNPSVATAATTNALVQVDNLTEAEFKQAFRNIGVSEEEAERLLGEYQEGKRQQAAEAFETSTLKIDLRGEVRSVVFIRPNFAYQSPTLEYDITCSPGATAYFETGLGSLLSVWKSPTGDFDQVGYCSDYDGNCDWIHYVSESGKTFTKHELFGGGFFPYYVWPYAHCSA